MEKFFGEFRNKLAEEGTWPLPFHDFFLQDLAFSEGAMSEWQKAPHTRTGPPPFSPLSIGGTNPEAVKRLISFFAGKIAGTSFS
jgi:hypothetical protein